MLFYVAELFAEFFKIAEFAAGQFFLLEKQDVSVIALLHAGNDLVGALIGKLVESIFFFLFAAHV